MRRIASTFYSESRRPISRQELDHSPLIAFYEITQACELACTHCRARAQPFRSSDELTPDEGRKLVDQLTQFPRPPALVVTGGDPQLALIFAGLSSMRPAKVWRSP